MKAFVCSRQLLLKPLQQQIQDHEAGALHFLLRADPLDLTAEAL